MACKNICKLCPKLILSDAVTYTAPNLVVDIPAGAYADGNKYCLVIAQAIPSTTTINSPVVVSIGGGATAYPLVTCDGSPVYAQDIATRTKYSTKVITTTTGGSFKLLGCLCSKATNLSAIS